MDPRATSDALPWMRYAWREATDGIPEEPNRDNRGPVIRRLIATAKCGSEGDPYCAVGVNAAFEANGIPGTRSALARSFERDKNFIRLSQPCYGAVTTFWRKSKNSGLGHVGFYIGETANHIYVLGWNQHDDCNQSPFPKEGGSFGLSGFWWPVGYPKGEGGRIKLSGNGRPIAGDNLKVT